MLRFVRDGYTVIVHSMDRLARNLDDLRRIVCELTATGVCVQFIKEQLIFTGEDTVMANLLLSVTGAFAEFERVLIGERQREGIALGQKARRLPRGRKRSLSEEQAAQLRRRAGQGVAKTTLARELGIAARRSTNTCVAVSPHHRALQIAEIPGGVGGFPVRVGLGSVHR
jgi:DNA invertase Pin-like site-specific DNA recombinase